MYASCVFDMIGWYVTQIGTALSTYYTMAILLLAFSQQFRDMRQ